MSDEALTTNDLLLDAEPFVGRWQGLVSTTNWEKGRIILEWRDAIDADPDGTSRATDEMWSQLVGGVTPQHVGRLRRVYERFQDTYRSYAGLFWSHFHTALEWEDAEMWLEGAVQNGWSVSQMRHRRNDTLGGTAPEASEVELPEELDEDFSAEEASLSGDAADGGDVRGVVDAVDGSSAPAAQRETRASDKSADDDDTDTFASTGDEGEPHAAAESIDAPPRERPFENLPALTDDLADAMDALKVVVLRHKMGGWQEVSPDNLLSHLDALKQLVLAPSGDDAA